MTRSGTVDAAALRGKQVLVVGLGRTGASLARHLTGRGARVRACDRRADAALPDDVADVELVRGTDGPELLDGVDLVVPSPGVPADSALLREACRRGVPLWSEIELAAREIAAPLVAITGTNGKSTVTTLVGEMMRRTGRPTFVGGNLGRPLSEAVGTEAGAEGGVLVVEVSSFQLERVRHFAPAVAVLLNVSADHLDRYSSFEAYAEAKGNVFAGQRAGSHAIVPSGDALSARLASRSRGTVHLFAGEGGEVRMEGGQLRDGASGLSFPRGELRLAGRHNEDNACAAMLAARLAGADTGAIASALREIRGLAHRAVIVRELDGVTYVDDSKATNVGATVAALDGLASHERRAVLIAGGVDKGGSYAPIAERMREVGRGVVLIGQAADLLERALEGLDLPVERARSMEEAVQRARGMAERGDFVLLAPACSSFDMFTSYAHRGDVFQAAVRALSGEEGTWA